VDEVKPVDSFGNVAEVLRLYQVERMSVRRIAFHLQSARKTVRELLRRHEASALREPLRRHQASAKPSMRSHFVLDPNVKYSDTLDVRWVGTK
jgi:hypothetical protein